MDDTFATTELLSSFHPFFLVTCRLIGMASFMPFLSLAEISPRFRLMAALAFAFLITPSIPITIEPTIGTMKLASLILQEVMIGAFVGLIARLLITMLDIAGTMISSQIGLSSATSMNPNLQGSALTSMILTLFGTAVILSMDLHHLILLGLINSYSLFPVNGTLMTGDIAQGYITMFAKVFWMGIQLSIPFMIVFLVMQVAFGLMNRMIPSMQIFFVSLPFQLWAGLVIFLITGGSILMSFGTIFQDEFRTLFKLG